MATITLTVMIVSPIAIVSGSQSKVLSCRSLEVLYFAAMGPPGLESLLEGLRCFWVHGWIVSFRVWGLGV